jgi:hypothetical protein
MTLRWGLMASWSKDAKGDSRLSIPADGLYE